MALVERLAKNSVKRALTGAAVASGLITAAGAAAKIWWSRTAALVLLLVGVTIYIVVAVRCRPCRRPPLAT